MTIGFRLLVMVVLTGCGGFAGAQRLDLTLPEEARHWHGLHDVAPLQPTANGILIAETGDDPYLAREAISVPMGKPLWVTLKLKTEKSGLGQIYWFSPGGEAAEKASVQFPVKAGGWREVRVPLPPQTQPLLYLRLDPPGLRGNTVILASLNLQPRISIPEPRHWEVQRPSVQDLSFSLQNRPAAFLTHCASAAYLKNGRVVWFSLKNPHIKQTLARKNQRNTVFTWPDPDGGTWTFTEECQSKPGGITDIQAQLRLSQKRDVLFFPAALLFVASGSKTKQLDQCLFSGLEYLGKGEASSGEKDLVGAGSERLSPPRYKITLPLMAASGEGVTTGFSWRPSSEIQPFFEVPDRHFGTSGAVFGLAYPGTEREGSRLLPNVPASLKPKTPVSFRYTVTVSGGESIVPALSAYVSLSPPPAPADLRPSARFFSELMGSGWVRSKLHDEKGFRHAYPGSFKGQRAADAVLFLAWCMLHTSDKNLFEALLTAQNAEKAQLSPSDWANARVGHIGSPAPALIGGNIEDTLPFFRQRGELALSRFRPDGSLPFVPAKETAELGKTHFANTANGLESRMVQEVLEAAALTGDTRLKDQGLKLLDRLERVYRNDVPRGAQTWEVPLHTPDILASAQMVRCFTLGYDLTGKKHYLQTAVYWAGTGLPFVYLVNPIGEAVGPYATIAVFGATQFTAPNWMGLPVQWCGLVYADALFQLEERTGENFWKKVAEGITRSGIEQTWPLGENSERVGLLPDSFDLQAQSRNDVAINPATLMACAVRLYGVPVYSSRRVKTTGGLLHAPGALSEIKETEDGSVSFRFTGWQDTPVQLLLTQVSQLTEVQIDGQKAAETDFRFHPETKTLILSLNRAARIKLRLRSNEAAVLSRPH